MTQSFIERQFPVSKISKESYKERKASQGQTITGLGKWWGRKPLILVRAAILGCLLPSTDNPEKDMDIFLKLLSMDEEGLLLRREKNIPVAELYKRIKNNTYLSAKYGNWFDDESGKVLLHNNAPRYEIERDVFQTLTYDQKIALCMRPEHLLTLSKEAWRDINLHLGTHVNSISELVHEISKKRFGKNVIIGDCFCGGGSIPFEAARIGCDTYASDLNPIAGLLTWADLNICGASPAEVKGIVDFQRNIYNAVEAEICELGIENNKEKDRALSYLYCVEALCPECGWRVPMLPSLAVGIRAGRVIAELHEKDGYFDISIKSNASLEELKRAKSTGTVSRNAIICPHCGKATPISVLRHDRLNSDGSTDFGLRLWEKQDFCARTNDIYSERLYAIRYEKPNGQRYYSAPDDRDLENERILNEIVGKNLLKWQEDGIIPSMEIEKGYNTNQLIRERGWRFWHQLFNARQLFLLSRYTEKIISEEDKIKKAAGILGLNLIVEKNSKLCMWDSSRDTASHTFYNQALNTLFSYSARGNVLLKTPWTIPTNNASISSEKNTVSLLDARNCENECDIWITDPPYADAVNYHELSEYFLSWDQKLLQEAFPDWYTDSKRVLAVRGDEHFSQTMIDIYSNLTRHMSDDGMQVVMFTHSNPAVWAQLALIMWKSGLTVTAAWNIATETDASGLKDGNYVKGTVLLVLRKQLGEEEAFLDELFAEVKSEVKNQIESMQDLDDREDPNFSDPDYVLAAYAASLKVLTGYKSIVEIDLDYELDLAIHDPSKSEVVKLIERAKKIAYDFIIPLDFDHFLWRDLSAAERFYVKGLEAEKHGNYQISTYQEYARGFGLTSYSQLMASERANTARLKVPQEFGMRTVGDVPGFEQSILRLVLASIHVAIKEDENPEKGFWHIKNNLADYWGRRDMLRQLFSFLKDTEDIDTMPHWHEAAIMASHIYTMIDNDHI